MKKLVIGTCTSYPDTESVRFKLALQFLKEVLEAGYALVHVDRSPFAVQEAFREIGSMPIGIDSKASYGTQQRVLFRHIEKMMEKRSQNYYGAAIIQPEKVGWISQLPWITEPLVNDEADIVLPTRSPASILSLPSFQARSEWAQSVAFWTITGLRGFDMGFLPIYGRKAALHFASANLIGKNVGVAPDAWVEFAAIATCAKAGLRFAQREVHFLYPEAQRREEEDPANTAIREKRELQRATIIKMFEAYAR